MLQSTRQSSRIQSLDVYSIGSQRAGRRLGLYQQILQQGHIAADDSYDQIELRLSGLVIEQQGKLRVYNRIYGAVFNQDWVDQALADLRPYAALITPWLASNCNDKSRLLRGQALRDAQAWAAGKSLGDRDYQFLARSQELEQREVQVALEAERQAKQILAEAQRKAELALEEERKANQGLAEAQRKTKQQIRLGVAAMVIMLGIAAVAGVFAQQSIQAANQREKSANKATQDAQNKEKQAQQNVKLVEDKRIQAEGKAQQAQQNLNTAVNQQKLAQVKAQQAQQAFQAAVDKQKQAEGKAQQAQQNLKTAAEKQQQAQRDAQQAVGKLNVANQNIQAANRDLTSAKAAAEKAQADAQQAQANRQQAEVALKEAQNQQTQSSLRLRASNQSRRACCFYSSQQGRAISWRGQDRGGSGSISDCLKTQSSLRLPASDKSTTSGGFSFS